MDYPWLLALSRWGPWSKDHCPCYSDSTMRSHQPGQKDGIQREQLENPYSRKPSNQKIWPKRYRTEIAASASSLLSTFAAVSSNPSCWYHNLTHQSSLWTQLKHGCKPTNMTTSQIAFDTPIRLRSSRGSFGALQLLWQASLLCEQYPFLFTRSLNTHTRNGWGETLGLIR